LLGSASLLADQPSGFTVVGNDDGVEILIFGVGFLMEDVDGLDATSTSSSSVPLQYRSGRSEDLALEGDAPSGRRHCDWI